jgi:predicted aminopeptidase
MKPGIRVLASIVCAALMLSSCSTVGYYYQAIDGQWELLRRAVPIDQVIAERGVDDALSRKLARVQAIRDFASRELALPDNRSYRRYADLGRPYVVWNVFAAPEFSVRSSESCFPIAGCVAYRGFYAEADARAYVTELAGKGLDTFFGGVPAYSTLGWFDDPVLSTFINFPEAELARILFHELAHQVVYVRDDTQFNESFAVAVEQEGVRRWLELQSGAGAGEVIRRWAAGRARQAELLSMASRHRRILEAIYASASGDPEKRRAKARQFQRMMDDYALLKVSWDGYAGYDRLFSQGPNNALLASLAAYSDFVPGFTALIEKHAGDLKAFYGEVGELSRMDKNTRADLLRSLARKPSH